MVELYKDPKGELHMPNPMNYTDALHLVANIQMSVSFSSNTLVMTDIIEEGEFSHEERTTHENGREELPCGS